MCQPMLPNTIGSQVQNGIEETGFKPMPLWIHLFKIPYFLNKQV